MEPWARLLLLIYEKEGLTEAEYKKELGSTSFYRAMEWLKEYGLIKDEPDTEERVFLTEDGKEIAEKLKRAVKILEEIDDKLIEIAMRD